MNDKKGDSSAPLTTDEVFQDVLASIKRTNEQVDEMAQVINASQNPEGYAGLVRRHPAATTVGTAVTGAVLGFGIIEGIKYIANSFRGGEEEAALSAAESA